MPRLVRARVSRPIDKSLFIVIFGLHLHISDQLPGKFGEKGKRVSRDAHRRNNTEKLGLFTFMNKWEASSITPIVCSLGGEGNWFENLITSAVRASPAERKTRMNRHAKFNPYQLTRMIDSSRFHMIFGE